MKKILVVGDFIKGSGLTNYLLNIYGQLSSEEFEINCMSFSGALDMDDRISSNHWKKYSVTPVKKNILKHFTDWVLFFLRNRNEYQIIHFNYSSSWNFWAILMAKMFTNSKIIVQSHNVYYSKNPKKGLQSILLAALNYLGRYVINICTDEKIAVSKEAAVWMFGKSTNIRILKNGINVNKYGFSNTKRLDIRKKYGISSDKIVIGFVGVLSWRKNPKFALECLQRLNEKTDKYVLCIFGRGDLEEQLKQFVRDAKLEDNVYFMGVSNNLNDWYSAFDLFIFPSITEGFGFALLEAEANGLCCFASDSIPNDAKVSSNVIDLNLKHINDWVEAITDTNIMLNDRIQSSKLACDMIVSHGFSLDDTSREFIDILNGVN